MSVYASFMLLLTFNCIALLNQSADSAGRTCYFNSKWFHNDNSWIFRAIFLTVRSTKWPKSCKLTKISLINVYNRYKTKQLCNLLFTIVSLLFNHIHLKLLTIIRIQKSRAMNASVRIKIVITLL